MPSDDRAPKPDPSVTHLGVPVRNVVSLESGGARSDEEDAFFCVDSVGPGSKPFTVPDGHSLVVTDLSVLGPLVVNDMYVPVSVSFTNNGRRRFVTHVRVRESCHHHFGAGIVVPAGSTPRVKAPATEITVQLLGYLLAHPGNAEGSGPF